MLCDSIYDILTSFQKAEYVITDAPNIGNVMYYKASLKSTDLWRFSGGLRALCQNIGNVMQF